MLPRRFKTCSRSSVSDPEGIDRFRIPGFFPDLYAPLLASYPSAVLFPSPLSGSPVVFAAASVPHEKSRPRRGRDFSQSEYVGGYLVTRSSHLTIESMTSIEAPQAATNTPQVSHIGVWM